MDDKILIKSDINIGVELEVKKNNARSNRIGFSSNLFSIGEKVRVISQEQYTELVKDLLQVEEYKSTIKELESTSSDAKLKKEVQKKDKEIKDLKSKLKDLEKSIDNVNKELDHSNKLLSKSKEYNDSLKNKIAELENNNNIILPPDIEKREEEFKQTITNQQSHIDALNKKLESLISLKEYISPKQHYGEIDVLKDKINDVEKELDKNNAEVETKLAVQKSEYESKIASQKSDLQIAHNTEKAQMLVAYNQELNNHKLKYNELAKDYNHLLSDANSLSRTNTLFNGRHKSIVKDKEPVELETIETEDSETIEYVPKDEMKLI